MKTINYLIMALFIMSPLISNARNASNLSARSAALDVSVTGVTVSPSSTSTYVNFTEWFTAEVLPSNATNKNVTWSSSNTAVATVDNAGLVTGRGDGVATITVTTQDGGKTASGTITISSIHVTSVGISPSSISIDVNATYQLNGIVLPFQATNQNLTWSSSNTSVATVSSTGVVTGNAAGNVTIFATSQDGGKIGQSAITVNPVPVTGITTSPTSEILVNSTETFTADVLPANATNKNVTWSSSNNAIATIISTGYGSTGDPFCVVSGLAVGTVTITVTTQDGNKVASSVATVFSIPVQSVHVDPTSVSVAVNSTQQLSGTVLPFQASNQNVTWSSSNTAIATVSGTGLVTGKAVGTATITATSQDGGKTGQSAITVYIPVTGVSVFPTTAGTIVNYTSQLTATITPSDATNKTVTWSCSNNSVATVSSTGLVTGLADGTVVITATTQDGGKTASGTVTISSVRVTSAGISPSSISLIVNATQQLNPIVLPMNATNKNVTWSSSNTSVATVSSTGFVTAKAAGTAVITVTTQDGGKTGFSTITVTSPGGSWATPTRYQAENGFNSCISVSSTNSGYSGTGYVTGLTTNCSQTKFDKGVNAVTPTKIDIRYANGTTSNITNLALYIGSNQKIQDLVLTPTGSWSTWGTVVITFNHDPSWGSNIIIKSISSVAVSANIDFCDLYVGGTASRVMSDEGSSSNDNAAADFSAYPNPANDKLNVTFYAEKECESTLELTTTMSEVVSKSVHRASKGKNTVTLDVKGFKAGVYILGVRTPSQNVSRKIIIGQ